MRLDTVKREVSSAGVIRTASATIKATPKIFDMFENGTYANKPVAIMRELVANGQDAHGAAGRKDRPVEVVLPTQFDPTCRIRDFGTGMSELFILGDETTPSKFMAYTDGSTKDKDNDAIGGMGIGSKSPFAYVDQYTLRVVHEAVLSVYTMYKDETGIPAVGLQAQTTTDEPNGVEVSFPVEDTDIATFVEAAQEALQYFQPLPLVTNGTLDAPSYSNTGSNWALRHKAADLGVIMGGIRYPVAPSSLDYSLRTDKRLAPLLTYGIDLTLPIGACPVATSREALQYTPKTTASIKAGLEAILDDVVATFGHFFDSCPSEWDAMQKMAEEIGVNTYNRSARAQLLAANALYQGKKLETSMRFEGNFVADIKAWRIEPRHARRGVNCPASSWRGLADMYGITPGEIENVIIDDLPQSPKSKTVAKIREFVDTQPQARATLVLRGSDERQATRLHALIRKPTKYILTSTLPEPAAKQAVVKNTRPKVRMFTFNGQKDQYTHRTITNLTPGASKSKAVAELPYLSQPSSGIMVKMSGFDLPANFEQMMNTKLVSYDELVFVNNVDADKIKSTFKDFADVFKERLDAALKLYGDLATRIAVADNSTMQEYFFYFQKLAGDRRWDDLPKAAKERPFGRLFSLYLKYVEPLTEEERSFGPFVKAALPAGPKPEALQEAMEEKQPDVVILLNKLDLRNSDHRRLFFRNI